MTFVARLMRASRRTITVMILLGLVTAVFILLQRHAPSAGLVDAVHARPPVDGGQQATPAPQQRASTTAAMDLSDETARRCAQTLEEAAKFAAAERDAANRAPQLDEERLRAEMSTLQRNLADSRDPQLFLAALLLDPPEARASNDRSANTTLRDLGVRAASSNSPLLAWNALRICVDAKELCSFSNLEQKLLDADRQNAEAWALVAMLRYRRGDVAGALAAMQGAARAPTSTWYWTETVAALDRALTAGTAIPYPTRLATAFGSAAGNLPQQPSQMCQAESANSRAWAEACLAFGTLRTEHNETELARGVAYSIRKQALQAVGDSAGAAEVAAESVLFAAERDAGGTEATGSMGELRQALIETDPTRLRAFLGDIHAFGENEGFRTFLRRELPPLLERAGMLERNGTRECVAQFFEAPVAAGSRAATAAHEIQVADRLLVSVRGGPALLTTVQVRPDGKIMIPHASEITALGRTTGELEREIATLPRWRSQSPEVFVILLSTRSGEELRLDFDKALRETAERRAEPR
jgi:hypothetical protein